MLQPNESLACDVSTQFIRAMCRKEIYFRAIRRGMKFILKPETAKNQEQEISLWQVGLKPN